MCITKECEDPTVAGVWWRDDAEWKLYDAVQAATITKGLTNRATPVQLENVVSAKYSSGASYVVDLNSMTQINLSTNFMREVRVVKAPSAAAAVKTAKVAKGAHSLQEDDVKALRETLRTLNELAQTVKSDLAELKAESKKNEAVMAKVTQATQAAESRQPGTGTKRRWVNDSDSPATPDSLLDYSDGD